MTRDDLIRSARGLTPPGEAATSDYRARLDALAAEISRHLGARPDIERLIGPGNRAMMEDNHRNHARFMESLFVGYSAEIFVDTILWVFRAYRAHGFALAYWPAQLDTWLELLRRELPGPSFRAIEPFYRWMLINQPAFAALSDGAVPSPAIPSHTV